MNNLLKMGRSKVIKNKKDLLVAVLSENSVVACAFCKRAEDDELKYGKIYSIGDISCHYFCVLLSCCLVQGGEDHQGLLGFLYTDIQAEIERGKKSKCSYCGRCGATLGCSVTQCRKQFHLPCGRERGALSLFYGNYKTFCIKHTPKQNIPEHIMAKAQVRMLLEKNKLKAKAKSKSALEATPTKEPIAISTVHIDTSPSIDSGIANLEVKAKSEIKDSEVILQVSEELPSEDFNDTAKIEEDSSAKTPDIAMPDVIEPETKDSEIVFLEISEEPSKISDDDIHEATEVKGSETNLGNVFKESVSKDEEVFLGDIEMRDAEITFREIPDESMLKDFETEEKVEHEQELIHSAEVMSTNEQLNTEQKSSLNQEQISNLKLEQNAEVAMEQTVIRDEEIAEGTDSKFSSDASNVFKTGRCLPSRFCKTEGMVATYNVVAPTRCVSKVLPRQPKLELLGEEPPALCVICYEEVQAYPCQDSFWPPCCARDGWFHRTCLQRMALSAGMHYLKCPLCNDKDYFHIAVAEQGIYIPDRDAAWELEQNAYAEIYERPKSCSADNCRSHMGRKHDADSGLWELKLCLLCGSVCVHGGCLPEPSAQRYICIDCSVVAPPDLNALEAMAEADQERTPAPRRGPRMPCRMSLRRTKQRHNSATSSCSSSSRVPTPSPSKSIRPRVASRLEEFQEPITVKPKAESSSSKAKKMTIFESRLQLGLKKPKKDQKFTFKGFKEHEKLSLVKELEDRVVSPLKLIEKKLYSKISCEEGTCVDFSESRAELEEIINRIKKPGPMSVKRRIVNEILEKILDECIKEKTKEDSKENVKQDEQFPLTPMDMASVEVTPAKFENDFKVHSTPIKTQCKYNLRFDFPQPESTEKLLSVNSSDTTLEMPAEFFAEEKSEDSLEIFETPQRNRGVKEIDEPDLTIKEVDDVNKDVDIVNLIEDKSTIHFSPGIEQSLQENKPSIDVEMFKSQYLSEVERDNYVCSFKHQHGVSEPTDKKIRIRSAIDFAIDASYKKLCNLTTEVKEEDTANENKCILKDKEIKHSTPNAIKKESSKKLLFKNKKSKPKYVKHKRKLEDIENTNESNTSASDNFESSFIDLTMHTPERQKKAKKHKRNCETKLSFDSKQIRLNIKWKRQQFQLKIRNRDSAQKTKRRETTHRHQESQKPLKRKLDVMKSPINENKFLKQTILNFSPEATSPLKACGRKDENVASIKRRKQIKQEIGNNSFKQTSIHSFFARK